MAEAAVQITGLRARAQVPPDDAFSAVVDGCTLRLGLAALRVLLPPGAPLRLDALSPGRVLGRAHWKGLPFPTELRVEGTAEGRIRVRLTSVRAGILPLPVEAVAGIALAQIQERPGLRRVGHTLEIDPAALLAPLGLTLPPVRRVTVDEGRLEIEW